MRFRTFATQGEFERHAVDLLATACALETPGPYGVMLTGGHTPLGVYAKLAARAMQAPRTLNLLISDERHVPPGSPEYNFAHVEPLGRALGVSQNRMLRVDTTLELDAAAADYAGALRDFLMTGRIGLGVLGLGADGHLASLFSDEDARRGAGALAVAVKRPTPPHRISVTPELLRRVERLVFWVTGPAKADVVKRLRKQPDTVVAGRVVGDLPNVECWYSRAD